MASLSVWRDGEMAVRIIINAKFCSIALAALLIAIAPFISPDNLRAFGQIGGGNRISGFVYGLDRRPMPDLHLELLNDVNSMIARTRTNGGGYYIFSGMTAGNFTIRVYTFGTDYEEQEVSVGELVNTSRPAVGGGTRVSGFDSRSVDIYLRLRRGITPASVAIFVQDGIPPEAKKLYEKAVVDLDNKRNADGQAGLRAALAIFPTYFHALERLAAEYIALARPEGYEAAEYLLAIAVEVNPRAYKSWYGLAYARYSRAKYAEALPAIQKAVELNSYSPNALSLYGVLLRHAGKFAEAEKQLLKAKETARDTMPQVHWELALLYGNDMERYADAAKQLKLFLKARPEAKDADKIRKLIEEFESKAPKK
jgi:hypothetical protein